MRYSSTWHRRCLQAFTFTLSLHFMKFGKLLYLVPVEGHSIRLFFLFIHWTIIVKDIVTCVLPISSSQFSWYLTSNFIHEYWTLDFSFQIFFSCIFFVSLNGDYYILIATQDHLWPISFSHIPHVIYPLSQILPSKYVLYTNTEQSKSEAIPFTIAMK